MVTIGVFVRADLAREREVARRLDALPGVRTFALDSEGAIGLVFSAPDLEAAHGRLTEEIATTEGVLCAWPVHACLDSPAGVTAPVRPDTTETAGRDAGDRRN